MLHKNINSFHRIEGIPTQYGIKGAAAATKADMKAWAETNAADFPSVPAQ